jgi:hypothetical protein
MTTITIPRPSWIPEHEDELDDDEYEYIEAPPVPMTEPENE